MTDDLLAEIEQLKQRLANSQKLESLGQLTSGIAHEINTPLQYIGDNMEFLRESFEELLSLFPKMRGLDDSIDLEYYEEEIPAALRQNLEGIKNLSQLVRSMKSFTHPGQGSPEPTDVNRLVEDMVTVSRNQWKYVATMEMNLGSSVGLVDVYPGEIGQVVLNLVVNAAHAIEDYGDSGEIQVTTERQDKEIVIEIKDNGAGVPKEIQQKVFEPFFTTKPAGKGTGQGLALAKEIIEERHKGSLALESQPGSTVFTIRIPDVGAVE